MFSQPTSGKFQLRQQLTTAAAAAVTSHQQHTWSKNWYGNKIKHNKMH
jgi:hypothetical protein